MTNKKKMKKFKKAVELTFDSLKSHITWTEKCKRRKSNGSVKFHKKCLVEYSQIIDILCKLYKEVK